MGLKSRHQKPTKNGESSNDLGLDHGDDTMSNQAPTSHKGFECDISVAEGISVILVWSTCIAYIGYCIYLDSDKILSADKGYHFLPGWSITHRLKDFSNFEWEFWLDFYTVRAWPVLLGHVMLNMFLSSTSQQFKLLVNIVYSTCAAWWLVNGKILIFLLGYIIYGYFMAWMGSATLIWSSGVFVLAVTTTDAVKDWISKISDDGIYPRKEATMIFAVLMISMRIISFGLDWQEHRNSLDIVDNDKDSKNTSNKMHEKRNPSDKQQELPVGYDFLRFLHYALYVPLFFTGPMFNYGRFQKEYWNPSKQWTRQSFKTFIIYGLRVAFAFVVCELMLHYMYFNAINFETMETISLWSLAGIGYYHAQFFMVKYVVLFGLPRFIAMTDHIDAPTTPSCVGRLGSSMLIWRTFDRGLYIFMTKYIYIPLGGSQKGVLRKVLGSALCFSFVFFWHGAVLPIFIWVFVNFINTCLEAMCGSISKLPAVHQFQEKYLSKATTRHLISLLRAPCTLFTTIGVNTFYARDDKTWTLYVNRLVFEGFPTSFLLCIFFLFCLGQTSHFITAIEKSCLRKICHKGKDLVY